MDLPSPAAAYFGALRIQSTPDLRALAHPSADPAAWDAIEAGLRSWATYDERPRRVHDVNGVLVIESDFVGSAASGPVVESSTTTALAIEDGRIRTVATWLGEEPPFARALETVMAYFRAANTHDWARFSALWADDGEMSSVGGPRRTGRTDVVAAYRAFLGMFAAHEDHPQRVIINGTAITVTGRFEFSRSAGAPASVLDWADVIELSADHRRIDRLSHWHDRDQFRRLAGPAR